MKLRNKKTGKILKLQIHNIGGKEYNSLAEINEEWEDYEETEEYYCIDWTEPGIYRTTYEGEWDDFNKEIGNYFSSREEAEKAVEKLKAWKRLKDKGFRFDGWTIDDGLKISICTNLEGDNIYSESEKEIRTNLNLLFGGEE